MKQDEVLAGLAEILGRVAKVDPAEVRAEQTFAADLGIDSVTMVDVVVAAEDRFGVLLLDDDWSRSTPTSSPATAPITDPPQGHPARGIKKMTIFDAPNTRLLPPRRLGGRPVPHRSRRSRSRTDRN